MSDDPAVQAVLIRLEEHDPAGPVSLNELAVDLVGIVRPIERTLARSEAVTDLYAAGYITAEQASALLTATAEADQCRTEPCTDCGGTGYEITRDGRTVGSCESCRPFHVADERRAAVRTEPEQ